jgi:hypothetical protein
MNERLQAWVEALLSGEYKQGMGLLYDTRNNSWCCLGVLCNVYINETKSVKEILDLSLDEAMFFPVDEVFEWAGISDNDGGLLADLNDHGHSFKSIVAKMRLMFNDPVSNGQQKMDGLLPA